VKADTLGALRKRFTRVNRRLLDALNERMRLIDEARAYKLERGLPFHDPARQEQMIQELLAANGGPMSASELEEIFRKILAVSLAHMERGPSVRR
jgi:3-deoxy-7-phosphoheptulonate synthase / chorismate mutase